MQEIKSFKYASLEAFLAVAGKKSENEYADSNGRDSGFYGSETFEQGVEIVRHGVNVDQVALHLSGLTPGGNRTTIEVQHDVAGAVVDIGAYLEGVPENMMDFPIVEDVKFIDVVISTNDLAHVPVSVFNNKAIGTAYLVDKLENDGYRVRLIALGASGNVGRLSEIEAVSVVIKDYNEALSVGQISGACSSAFFRRLIFRHREIHFNNSANGATCEMSALRRVFKTMFDPGTKFIYLPNHRSMESLRHLDLTRVEGAIKWAEYYAENLITV